MSLAAIAGLPITKVTESPALFNMLIYGESGAGKTTLAGSADDVPEMRRVLILDIEGGTLSLRSRYPNVEAVRIKSWEDMQRVYDELYLGAHGYNTIVIDSLTETQKMCYSSDTELLTINGWRNITEITTDDLIAQYEVGSEKISFVNPSKVVNFVHDERMISIPTKSSGLLITNNHRVLAKARTGTISIKRADELRKGMKLPTSGIFESTGGPTTEQARLLVAWAADGHKNYTKKGMKFHLSKQDKIDRLKKLIVEAGLQYRSPDWKDNGCYIIVDDASAIKRYMPDRMWNSYHMMWSTSAREAVMAELPHWDSQPRNPGSFQYHTSYKSNADAISALASITGWSSSISQPKEHLWNVNLVRTTWRTITQLTTEEYSGKVWCVTVPSGFIVTRRNGKATICGNSMDAIMLKLVAQHEERDADVPGIREWNINIEQTRKFVRLFRDLPVNTIFTALAKADRNQRTGLTRTKPYLSGKVADEVAGFLDIVAYLYTKEVDGTQKRMLLCGATQDNVAKDRTDRLDQVIQEPTMSTIWTAVKGITQDVATVEG